MRWFLACLLLALGCSSKAKEPEPTGRSVALSYELVDESANFAMAEQVVDAIRTRLKSLDIEARVEIVGTRIRVEIDDASSDDIARARGALDARGRLEIRLVEANHPVMLKITRWAQEQEQARTSDVRREIDQWRGPGGQPFDDNYLSAPSRSAITNLVARFPEIAAIPPSLSMVYEQTTPANPAMKPRWRTYLVGKRAGVRGHIRDATVSTDPQSGPIITVSLDSSGQKAFAEFTAEHVGNKLAIIVDGDVRSVPVLQDPIPGGEVWINMGSGDRMTLLNEAYSLAAALRTPSLPSPLKLMSASPLSAK